MGVCGVSNSSRDAGGGGGDPGGESLITKTVAISANDTFFLELEVDSRRIPKRKKTETKESKLLRCSYNEDAQ